MKDRKNEIAGILLMVIFVFVLLSLVSYNPAEEPSISPRIAITNKMGILGVYVAHFLVKLTLGYVSYIFPLLGLAWGWWIFSKKPARDLIRLTLYVLALSVLTSTAIGLPAVVRGLSVPTSYQHSGLLGGLLAHLFHGFLGTIGTSLLLVGAALVLIRGYFNWSFYGIAQELSTLWARPWEKWKLKRSRRRKELEKRDHTRQLLTKLRKGGGEAAPAGRTFTEEAEAEPLVAPLESLSGPAEEIEEEGQLDLQLARKGEVSADKFTIDKEVIEQEVDIDAQMPTVLRREYQLPSIDLLDRHEDVMPSTTHQELVDRANFLIQSLMTFGVEGKVVNISPGPIITLFEVEPAEGVRVHKFVQLSDDLARVMEASRVRVIAPIPGKSSVGIEIPNKNPSIVYLRSVINSEKFISSESKLTVALGKTTSGETYVIELDKMPHLLVAGTTGSGKSVCMNTIIASLLYRATPGEVRFILIDPKKLELAAYRALEKYHLITSEDIDEYVVTTPDNAVLALRAAEQEMNRRYDTLAEAVVRNVEEYHEKQADDPDLEPMPYIIIIIDELADLMLRAPKEVEAPITRLAQMARAVGIHLVLATQRPSVDVITGVIKANFPARIAFQVATRVDSRTIIDMNGAEKLLGKGDMLFLPPGSSDPIRLHNSFVSLNEIHRIVDHVTSQPTAEELMLPGSKVQLVGEDVIVEQAGGQDELFSEAVRLVVIHQQGSISLLQRRLRVGYARAARLIDQMEQAGIVGPFTGSKAREVLVDESYLVRPDDDAA